MAHDDETFMYFGYGSNLLQERLRIMNPSAEFCCVGQLKGFKFRFELRRHLKIEECRWRGGGATIRPGETADVVYGCIWRIHNSDLANLDRQEAHYFPMDVNVLADSGETITCRTYQMREDTDGPGLPSRFYKHVVIEGAHRNKFPPPYIEYLYSLPHNNVATAPEIYGKVVDLVGEFHTPLPS